MLRRKSRAVWLAMLVALRGFHRGPRAEPGSSRRRDRSCALRGYPAARATGARCAAAGRRSRFAGVADKTKGRRRPEGYFHLQTVSLDGSFSIPAVPQGRYYVIAEQDGYISPLSLFTRAQLNDPDEAVQQKIARYITTISVTAGHTTQAEVTLIRGAVIAGTVRFEDGAPANRRR